MASGNFFQRPAVQLTPAFLRWWALTLWALATGPQVAQKRVQLSAGDNLKPPFDLARWQRLAYSASEIPRSALPRLCARVALGQSAAIDRRNERHRAVWSPDGAIWLSCASRRKARMHGDTADGGDERSVRGSRPRPDSAQPMPEISWNPDGKSLGSCRMPKSSCPGWHAGARLRQAAAHHQPAEGSEGDSPQPSRPPAVALRSCATPQKRGCRYLSLRGHRRKPAPLTFDDRGIRGSPGRATARNALLRHPRRRLETLARAASAAAARTGIAGTQATTRPSTQSPGNTPTAHRVLHLARQTGRRRYRRRAPAHPFHRREVNPAWSPDGTKIANVSDQTAPTKSS